MRVWWNWQFEAERCEAEEARASKVQRSKVDRRKDLSRESSFGHRKRHTVACQREEKNVKSRLNKKTKYAGVVELADTPDLGSGVPDVQVQVLSPAP